jgi:hypothetical protein
MDGCHVTIRLLDPPLHEFLPSGNMEDVCAMIASEHSISNDAVMDKLNRLSEVSLSLHPYNTYMLYIYLYIYISEVYVYTHAVMDMINRLFGVSLSLHAYLSVVSLSIPIYLPALYVCIHPRCLYIYTPSRVSSTVSLMYIYLSLSLHRRYVLHTC